MTTRDQMDDGTPICLSVTIDRRDGSAAFDFEGACHSLLGLISQLNKQRAWLIAETDKVSLAILGARPKDVSLHRPPTCRHRPRGVWQHQRAARSHALCHHLRAALHGELVLGGTPAATPHGCRPGGVPLNITVLPSWKGMHLLASCLCCIQHVEHAALLLPPPLSAGDS